MPKQDPNYSFLCAFARQLVEAQSDVALPDHVELALLRIRDGLDDLLGRDGQHDGEDDGGHDEGSDDELTDGDDGELERRRREEPRPADGVIVTASRRAIDDGRARLQRARPRPSRPAVPARRKTVKRAAKK